MDISNDHPHWKRMRFKRNKVWMAVAGDGQPIVQKGKVLVKYQLDQPHRYWVKVENIQPLDEETLAQASKAGRKSVSPAKHAPRPGKAVSKAPVAGEGAAPDDAICIYTDGACSGNPGPAGIGVVMVYQDHRREISRYIGVATNNIAELEAIKTGLLSVKNKDLPIVLFSDSSYSLGVLTQGWKAKQNQELVQEVRSLTKRFRNLRFVKIKGHAGHPENERADRLAVKAIQTGER